jgi:hypothetical protein
MEDAFRGQIQETGQERSPARMVGLSGLDSYNHPFGKEAARDGLDTDSRPRRGK